MIEKYYELLRNDLTQAKSVYVDDYKFYKEIGLTDEQSILLTLFPIEGWYSSSCMRYMYGNLKKKYLQSDKSISFSEFCLKHLEDVHDSYNDFMCSRETQPPIVPQLPVMSPNIPQPQPPQLSMDEHAEPETVVKPKKTGFFASLLHKKNTSRSVNYSYTPMRQSKAFFSMSPSMQFSMSEKDDGYDCGCVLDAASLASPTPTFQTPASIQYADTESYHHIEEHGLKEVALEPLSTFRTTCNTASIGMLLNNVQKGIAVKPDSIRIEELMNFFSYNLPKSDELFNIHIELTDKPNSNNKLLFIGVKGKHIEAEKQNIVILLDVSGSMSSNNVNMTKTIMTISSKLKIGDTFSLVTYSSEDHIVIDSMVFTGDLEPIIEKVFSIKINGCTNGSAGIEAAYKIAEKNYIANGTNKVVLITDGDLNFGINSNNGLEKLILEKKKSNVFLSVIGMGVGNFKDDKLEILAKNGNGYYCVINEEFGIRENILNRYGQFMHTIAKDVKAQVEFNPAKVKSYRLLGYENREISASEFHDDKVISEPFGAGSTCVALYEIELADGNKAPFTLKYQEPKLVDNNEYCTVSIRYKLPLEETSQLISKSLTDMGELSENVKLAFICYAMGEKYRNSKFTDLKDTLMAKYLAETMNDEVIKKLNGDKLELLKFLT